MFERFRFCGFDTVNCRFDKAVDDVVVDFLNKGISSVTFGTDCYHMYLTRGDLILIVWCNNRWYAFGEGISLVQNTKSHKVQSFEYEMLPILPYHYGKCLFSTSTTRPSYKTLLRLKKIYLGASK